MSIQAHSPEVGTRDAAMLAEQRPDHVLVCVSGAHDDLRLIWHGAQFAQRLHATLTVLYVCSPPAAERPRETLSADRQFARSVGAALVELPAISVAAGIGEYAKERGVTHVVLSDERRTPWYVAWHGSLVKALAGLLSDVEIFVLGDTALAPHGG